MIDLKNLRRAIEQLAQEKGIDAKKILEAIEQSIAAAYKKEYDKKGEIIKAKFDLKSGDLKFVQVKVVVDETTVRISKEGEEELIEVDLSDTTILPKYNSDKHIFLDEAKEIKKNIAVGEELEFPLETMDDFGRIAAQTAKQVILQKLRDAERESITSEFKNREGEIVSGTIQRIERGNVYIDLGRAIGVMFPGEGIRFERYNVGDRFKFLVLTINTDGRGPGIILSRSHPKFVTKLFALEVPEINDGSVEIKAVAREEGSRTKIAVYAKSDTLDPVGACVGQRGARVMAVSSELGQEKIDIIEWSEDPSRLIMNSLSPAKPKSIEILPNREAKVVIADNELSLAIGRGGQNVRLAAKLTGWKIDVRSEAKPEEAQIGGVAEASVEEVKIVKSETENEKSE
ncbi:MAG: transcription termination/antitermination protein NusA [Candidatus Pacebacteria bacterium]|nr:transcription termination/antitermination protein NusA [Candidatus Paceibacterota bacterium]